MQIHRPKKKNEPLSEWHPWFAWKPVRVNDDFILWLCYVRRRLVIDDEGNWAGGYIDHWEYRA